MFQFEVEAPIIMHSKQDISAYLRKIADSIDSGTESGLLEGQGLQGYSWNLTEIEETDMDSLYENLYMPQGLH